jgi:hypothetical protein
MTERVLTVADALAIGTMLDAAHKARRVSWDVDGHVISGVARHIVEGGNFHLLRGDEDVRDGYLRVSSTFEHLLPVPDVLEKIKTGLFVVESE